MSCEKPWGRKNAKRGNHEKPAKMKTRCPHCGNRHKIPDRYHLKIINCPSCKKQFKAYAEPTVKAFFAFLFQKPKFVFWLSIAVAVIIYIGLSIQIYNRTGLVTFLALPCFILFAIFAVIATVAVIRWVLGTNKIIELLTEIRDRLPDKKK